MTAQMPHERPDHLRARLGFRAAQPARHARLVHDIPHQESRLIPERLDQIGAVALAVRPEIRAQPSDAGIGNQPFICVS
ncbi:MAG: hypothetical protein U0703_09160 [Anaerolineae bacterium]